MGLPSGYKQLAYIESTGTQYINTGFKPNQNSRIVLDVQPTSTATQHIFGARETNTSGLFFAAITSATVIRVDYGNEQKSNTVASVLDRVTIDLNKNTCLVGNVSSAYAATTFSPNATLLLFGSDTAGTVVSDTYKARMKLYSCKVYDNGTLIRDYVPCVNESKIAGLYDFVDYKFYGNAASGAFTAGPFVYNSVAAGDVLDFDYVGAAQTVNLPPCRCKLEVWGAQGGYRSNSTYGGKGGYSVGEIRLDDGATVYVQVGGAGNTGGTNGGYNGGGKRTTYSGGGGATDIRIGEDSLYARVIVAGGGGSDGAANKKGMYGGGTAGGTTTESYGSGGEGGTQTAGGAGSNQSTTTAGTFGIGGDGLNASGGYAGAGGGGWYGGAGSYPDGSGDDDRGGGGGSGFVWVGLNAPSGYLLNESHYLTSASTVAGSTSFAGPNGTNETGHTGNGYARITVIELLGIPAPQNFKVSTKTENSISLSWDAADGSIGYVLKKDGYVIANITTTEFTDTTVKPYRSYSYSVYAYNETKNSPLATLKASAAEPYGFETIDYRTASDVEEAKKLQNRIANGTATEEEISKWLDGVIGAYNAWDMNRVENAVDFIQKYINGLQYVLDRYRAEQAIMSDPFWKVPWNAYDLLVKKDWVLEDIPSEGDLARYLANVDALTNAIVINKNLPSTMNMFTHAGANEIERALRKEYDECVAYEINTKRLIDNTKAAILYSGDIYGGELDA